MSWRGRRTTPTQLKFGNQNSQPKTYYNSWMWSKEKPQKNPSNICTKKLALHICLTKYKTHFQHLLYQKYIQKISLTHMSIKCRAHLLHLQYQKSKYIKLAWQISLNIKKYIQNEKAVQICISKINTLSAFAKSKVYTKQAITSLSNMSIKI